MLLFVVGTEFPVAKLRAVGRISLVVALAETLGTLMIVFFIAQYLEFSFFDSMFLSLAMSITSTVITVKVLEELGLIQDKSSLLLLGISIIEDILAISILAMLQSVAAAGGNGNDISIVNIAISIGVVGAFIGGKLVIGSKYMPPIIDRVGRTNNYTLLLLVILALAFGLSFVAQGLGLSVATGAFLAGVLVARIQKCIRCQNHDSSNKRHVCCSVFHLNRCSDGYITNTNLHNSSSNSHSCFICF